MHYLNFEHIIGEDSIKNESNSKERDCGNNKICLKSKSNTMISFEFCCSHRGRVFNACATDFPVDRRFRFCESRKNMKYTKLTLHSNFLTHDIRA